jgi:hypothetical protein
LCADFNSKLKLKKDRTRTAVAKEFKEAHQAAYQRFLDLLH